MAKRIKEAGMYFLLDFHYSDNWADPAKQIMPQAWQTYSYDEVCEAVYNHTKETLLALEAQGTLPDMVQVGNEVSNGMLWPYGSVRHSFEGLCGLLKEGVRAVREYAPDAEVMLHVALGGQAEESIRFFDAMAEYGIECRIKWTNDIYARDSKLVGVLIEHSLAGDTLARTIVGIGLNVNQTEFPSDLPNPTSMALQRSAKFDREEVLRCFMHKLEEWYDVLLSGNKQLVETTYVSRMYHLLEEHPYMLPSGEIIRARIRGVRPSGELILEHHDGIVREYAFKEIEFVLPHKSVQK